MDKFAITRKNFHQKEGLWCGNIDAIIGLPEHIDKIIATTYQYRKEDGKTYSCRVSMDEIKKNEGQIGEEKYWKGT